MENRIRHTAWRANRRRRPSGARRGFTLVELLTVIVIIGILVGLATSVVIGARNRASNAYTVTEINNLELALRSYADKYGEFPPDFCSASSNTYAQNMVMRHLGRVFPRYVPGALLGSTNTGTNPWTRFVYDLAYYTSYNPSGSPQASGSYNRVNGVQAAYLDPASALVFWLGGPSYFTAAYNGTPTPDTATKKPFGFSANPLNPFEVPFAAAATGTLRASMTSRMPILFPFDDTRLQPHHSYSNNTAGWAQAFYPRGISRRSVAPLMYAPYVYFRAEGGFYYLPGSTSQAKFWPYNVTGTFNNGAGLTEMTGVTGTTGMYRIRPYYNFDLAKHASVAQGSYFNPTTFQIVSAGLDGAFGGVSGDSQSSIQTLPPRFPAADNIQGQHYDNITNFTTSKGTLEDAFPPGG